MKKLIAALLLACLCTAAAACAHNRPGAEQIISSAPDTEPNITYHNSVSLTDIPPGQDGISSESGDDVVIEYSGEGLAIADYANGADSPSTALTNPPILTTSAAPTLTTAQPTEAPRTDTFDAVFLGVKDYGADSTNRQNMNDFSYLFSAGGTEYAYKMDNGTLLSENVYDYPIQNILKEGYRYSVSVRGGTVIAAHELPSDEIYYNPVVSGVPGQRTVRNFLQTALEPAGTTLYVFGGGWDWQDTGSSVQARSIGVSPDWVRFFNSQNADYTYKNKKPSESYYPFGGFNEYYYAGLDCSGYVGWAVYNTFNTQNGGAGYVMGASKMAKQFAANGWGSFSRDISGADFRPGDIMSIKGHVWISLGACGDGSVVILHSTPSPSRTGQPGGGVQLGAVGKSEKCDAYKLADCYMSQYCPEWYSRYRVTLKSPSSFFSVSGDDAGRFRWNAETLSDPDGLRDMSADDALRLVFGG